MKKKLFLLISLISIYGFSLDWDYKLTLKPYGYYTNKSKNGNLYIDSILTYENDGIKWRTIFNDDPFVVDNKNNHSFLLDNILLTTFIDVNKKTNFGLDYNTYIEYTPKFPKNRLIEDEINKKYEVNHLLKLKAGIGYKINDKLRFDTHIRYNSNFIVKPHIIMYDFNIYYKPNENISFDTYYTIGNDQVEQKKSKYYIRNTVSSGHVTQERDMSILNSLKFDFKYNHKYFKNSIKYMTEFYYEKGNLTAKVLKNGKTIVLAENDKETFNKWYSHNTISTDFDIKLLNNLKWKILNSLYIDSNSYTIKQNISKENTDILNVEYYRKLTSLEYQFKNDISYDFVINKFTLTPTYTFEYLTNLYVNDTVKQDVSSEEYSTHYDKSEKVYSRLINKIHHYRLANVENNDLKRIHFVKNYIGLDVKQDIHKKFNLNYGTGINIIYQKYNDKNSYALLPYLNLGFNLKW